MRKDVGEVGRFGIRELKKGEKQGIKTDKTLTQHSFLFDCFITLTQLENYNGIYFFSMEIRK